MTTKRSLLKAVSILTLIGWAGAAIAQSVQSYESTIYWCIDREGIRRLKNYPCGENERDADRVRIKSTIVTFPNAGGSAKLADTKPAKPAAEPFNAAEKMKALREAREQRQNACGPSPKIGKDYAAYDACITRAILGPKE